MNTSPQNTPEDNNDAPKPRMSRRRKTLLGLVGAALIGGALMGGVGYAKAEFGFGHRFGSHSHDPETMKKRASFGVKWVLSEVDASDQQIQRVTDIVTTAMGDVYKIAPREKRHEVREKMVKILGQEKVNRAELEALRTEMLRIADQVSARMLDSLVAVTAELTPEQRQELLEDHQKSRHQ